MRIPPIIKYNVQLPNYVYFPLKNGKRLAVNVCSVTAVKSADNDIGEHPTSKIYVAGSDVPFIVEMNFREVVETLEESNDFLLDD